ncbi:MAG TPA: arabinan endo-1,5-alpha-L-arabinosidase [Terriglobales bacterium]|jgi:arabinan endo-1,5-alpha-L-arabinosidase|nr:arabinan endo-1,5-alpha-L-arabinosidase [Terriglobales bacterium]
MNRSIVVAVLLAFCFAYTSCGSSPQSSPAPGDTSSVLPNYHLVGDTSPVRDPSIMRQGSTYYLFSTDAGGAISENLPIRCSTDKVNWRLCGAVFNQIPAWVQAAVPGIGGLWAPDISFFNGLYHIYYAGSIFATNTSVIGMATNITLDPSDPAYQWVDQGEVLSSSSADDFNAIDPNILVDTDGSIWLTYGSYWTGIKQRQIDPLTGKLSAGNSTIYSLATRPGVQFNPIEGSSLVHEGSYYYLFVSFDDCCNPDPFKDTYRIMVGRGASPHGPFIDMNGTDMMNGGGTQLLGGNGTTWNAPGGETVYSDPQDGDMITFHALHLPDGAAYVFVNSLAWPSGWPQIQP